MILSELNKDFESWWEKECETFYKDNLELKHYKTIKCVCNAAYLKGIADEMRKGEGEGIISEKTKQRAWALIERWKQAETDREGEEKFKNAIKQLKSEQDVILDKYSEQIRKWERVLEQDSNMLPLLRKDIESLIDNANRIKEELEGKGL
jgi:adenine-specific DNA methylase